MVISKLTIQLEQENGDDPQPDGNAYSDGRYFIVKERISYVGKDYYYVYRRNTIGQHSRMSGPLDALFAGIALVARLLAEDEAREKAA